MTNSVGISSGTQINPNGGTLDIRNGILVAPDGIDFSGSGRLVMSGGEYRNANLTTVPQLSNTYDITGGVLNLNGSGNQTLRGLRDYADLTFSGSGTKSTSNAINNISGTVSITSNCVLDVANNTFGSTTTNFTMTNGRFRTSRSVSSLPDMNGTYNLSGGTVELYGTGASQGLRGGKTYFNVEISNTSDAITAGVTQGAGTVTVLGNFTIKENACYKMGANSIINGSGNFIVEPNSFFFYASVDGISNTSTTNGNIRVSGTRNLSTDASYGFRGGASPQSVGSGLPNSVKQLIILKDNSNNIVQLQNDIEVKESVNLITGRLRLNQRVINLGLSGEINGENNSNYIFCLCPSGYIEKQVVLDETGAINPGNIGLEFTMNGVAPGLTTIRRRHIEAENDIDTYPASVHRKFSVSPANNSNLNLDLKFFYLTNEKLGGTTASDYKFVKTTDGGATWDYFLNSVSNTSDNSVSISGWNSFSDVTISELEEPNLLPIQLTHFSANYNKESEAVDIFWQTSSEVNNDFFTIYKSYDVINFFELEKIQGAGNSNITLDYQTKDIAINEAAIIYYQLKQTDFDASEEYFNIVAVQLVKENQLSEVDFSLRNNTLFFNNLTVNDAIVDILDMGGKLIYSQKIHTQKPYISLDFIPATGIYYVKLQNQSDYVAKKLFINSIFK